MEKSIMADVVVFCAWFKFYKKLFDLSPEMTFAANANVNAAVPRGRDIMPVAEREAARPAEAPRGRDIMPVAERGRMVEAARPEAARPAAAPRGPPQDRPVHRADEHRAGVHRRQDGSFTMSMAERGRHRQERW